MSLLLINPNTLINTDTVSSIEIQPDGRMLVFMTNNKVYSATKETGQELVTILKEEVEYREYR